VGEVTSARWVIEALLAARPGLQILVTTNTATGRAQVQAWSMLGVTAALAPVDSAGAAGRVLDRWRPQALVIVENELWPARLRAADNRGVPVLVIGARISGRSARRWRWVGWLMRPMLERIDWLSAQDSDSATVRTTFFIDPKGVIRAMTCYPANLGRSIPEMLRIVDGLQAIDAKGGMAPANWQQGEALMRPPTHDLDEVFGSSDATSWFLRDAGEEA
jgi:hypothetical protein